ncbi:TolC family protein [Propionivibrio sp.]|uniref:TolC family protein n=1 Tax=Propionivibrio sp. TaxID=2212460 RepID=UPI002630F22D|nr:TolC family protein [Propionivibrio sp.]
MHALRTRSVLLTLLTLASAFAPKAMAFGPLDPFNTEAITPPRPLLFPAGVPCQAPLPNTTYDVLDVVDLALCQNPRTHEAWANARAQAAQVGVAQSGYLPSLDGKATTSRLRTNADNSNQRSASLTLSWLLYDFGARSANLEIARQLLSAATSTLDNTVQSVFQAALQAYYNTQAARAAVIAALESEKASRESLSAAEVRYKVGTGTPADRLLAQTAWSQATLNRVKAEGAVKIAFGTLANVMGMNASVPLKLADIAQVTPDASFEGDIDALISEAQLRRPDLKAAQAQLDAAQSNIEYTRASVLPTLALGAGPNWLDTGGISNHGNSIGLTLTLPIFSGFETRYKVRSAQAAADAASAQRENLRLQVALDVWSAYQSLITATQTIRTTADLLASAEQSERVALGRYKAGVGSILDVLNAQSALAAARLQRIQALLDWHVSRAALAKAVGVLDSSLLNPAAGTP